MWFKMGKQTAQAKEVYYAQQFSHSNCTKNHENVFLYTYKGTRG